MSESVHALKARHKAELKALQISASKDNSKGAKKKWKESEQSLLAAQQLELQQFEATKEKQKIEQNEEKEKEKENGSESEENTAESNANEASRTASSSAVAAHNKSAKKKEKRAAAKAKESADAAARAAATMSASVDSVRQKELDTLNGRLHPLDLCIFPITSDGHCLFRALADQLQRHNIVVNSPFNHSDIAQVNAAIAIANTNSKSKAETRGIGNVFAEEAMDLSLLLRRVACNYIETHADDFCAFLINDDGAMESVSVYVDDLRRENENVKWGSHNELVAISNALHVNIEVHDSQALQPIVISPQTLQAQPVSNTHSSISTANTDLSCNTTAPRCSSESGRTLTSPSDSSSSSPSPSSSSSQASTPESCSLSVLRVSFHRHYYSLGPHYNSIIPLTAVAAATLSDAQNYSHAAGQVDVDLILKKKNNAKSGETAHTAKEEAK